MISLHNLGVIYKNGQTALQDINLELNPGEFAVVLGESGAGKSTLLRCINFLTRPTSGHIRIEGLGILGSPGTLREHRRRTGMIFQQHHLMTRCTVLQNVLVGRLAFHPTWRTFLPLPQEDHCIALDCLERVGLLNNALTPVKALSGGQQQRVGIARALAQKPSFLLADEPIASLDPKNVNRVLALLLRVCREDHLGALVSLHQVDLALQYADRIIGLSSGRVVYDGHPSDLDQSKLEQIYRASA